MKDGWVFVTKESGNNIPHFLQLFWQLGTIYRGFFWHSPFLAQESHIQFLSKHHGDETKCNEQRVKMCHTCKAESIINRY